MEWRVNETPKRHKMRHMTYRSSKSVHRCDLCAWRRESRDQQRNRNLTVANQIKFASCGWFSGFSSKFRASSTEVKRFPRCGDRNSPFPIALATGLYNSLYYHTSRGKFTIHITPPHFTLWDLADNSEIDNTIAHRKGMTMAFSEPTEIVKQ